MCGSTTRPFTNSATNTTRSVEHRTAHWISPSPNAPSAKCTRGCLPSRHCGVGRTSSCPGSTHCTISPRSATKDHHARSHLPPEPCPSRPHRWPPHQHLLDMELSMGSATGSGVDGESLLHDD